MGLEFLELTFGVQKEFGLDLSSSDWDAFLSDVSLPHDPGRASDVQIDVLLRWATQKCMEQHGRVPDDLWPRLQRLIVQCLGVDRDEVHIDAWLVRDLGMG